MAQRRSILQGGEPARLDGFELNGHLPAEVREALDAHAAAHVDPSGRWKVRKIKQSHKIDGLVASVIAYSRAARAPPKRTVAFAWA